MAALGGGPAAPLHAVHGAQVTVFARPFVPDADAARLEPVVVARALQKPQQLMHDGFEVNFFGGDQRKTFVEVKAHLVAKHTLGAGAGAVGLEDTVRVNMAHEVFVLGAQRVWR